MKLRKILIGCLLLCNVYANAQDAPLTNRWKETQRLNLKEKSVTYTDTLHILKIEKNEVSLRDNGFLYKAKIEKDKLDFLYRSFKIVKNNDKEIRLKDEEYIYVFSREAKDMSAADAPSGATRLAIPSTPVNNLNLEEIEGKWKAYKRENRNGPSNQISVKKMITSFSFDSSDSEVVLNGNESNAFKLVSEPNGVLKLTNQEAQVRTFIVWKLDSDELILEDEDNIVYFLKKFDN